MPVTSRANATFSQTVLVGSSLKSWKTIPILRRISGHLAARQAGEVLAVEDDLAARRQLVADEQLDEGRLAGARRPDEEDEVALGDDQVDVAQRQLAVRVALRDVVEDEERPFGSTPGRGPWPRTRLRMDRVRRRCEWLVVNVRLRGRGSRIRAPSDGAGLTPSAGTAAGATSRSRLPPPSRDRQTRRAAGVRGLTGGPGEIGR